MLDQKRSSREQWGIVLVEKALQAVREAEKAWGRVSSSRNTYDIRILVEALRLLLQHLPTVHAVHQLGFDVAAMRDCDMHRPHPSESLHLSLEPVLPSVLPAHVLLLLRWESSEERIYQAFRPKLFHWRLEA